MYIDRLIAKEILTYPQLNVRNMSYIFNPSTLRFYFLNAIINVRWRIFKVFSSYDFHFAPWALIA